MKNINLDFKNFQSLLIPVMVMIIIIGLIGVSVKILFDRVTTLNTQISESEKTVNTLQDKLTSLQVLSPNISANSEIISIAMPGTDPVLTALSQLKTNASESNLLIESITSAQNISIEGTDLNSSFISFEILGKYPDIFSFINKMKNSLPVTRFDILNISTSDSVADAYSFEGTLVTYWAPLPLTIPALTEPVTQLTNEEKDILTKLSGKTQPRFNAVDDIPSSASGKVNPFQ